MYQTGLYQQGRLIPPRPNLAPNFDGLGPDYDGLEPEFAGLRPVLPPVCKSGVLGTTPFDTTPFIFLRAGAEGQAFVQPPGSLRGWLIVALMLLPMPITMLIYWRYYGY